MSGLLLVLEGFRVVLVPGHLCLRSPGFPTGRRLPGGGRNNPAGAVRASGGWSRDCGSGMTCHLDVGPFDTGPRTKISFRAEGGGGEACAWSVDAVFDKGFDGPVARDPNGNHYFYLTVRKDGRLYSSGTMPQLCGSFPVDQYFDSDLDEQVENRSLFDHNGSDVRIDPAKGTIVYERPKSSIAKAVSPGTLLFKAENAWDPYKDGQTVRGTAFAFKKGCEPAPYSVVGRQQGWHTLVLKGAAPVREKGGCKVTSYAMNGNSVLKFTSFGD